MGNRRKRPDSILIPVLDKKGKPIKGQFQEYFPPGSQDDKYAKRNNKSMKIGA